ncbi:MAG: nucleoside hydrolase [Actinobacteria bacterium]|nr:nucleoside hydrolase [Actinomycetota bacterium]
MPESRRQSLVIDTDTASDDAVALLLALRAPGADVRAITVVAGNVPLESAIRNARISLEMSGADLVPIYAGCARPLVRELHTAQNVHGADGMSGAELTDPVVPVESSHAVEALLAIARDEPGVHDLVTLGPLTNIALALAIDPAFLTRFRHTWMMIGAADNWGNVSPTGEFNAWADPESAKLVLEADGPKTMVGWDISRKYAVITPEEDARLRASGRVGMFTSEINRDVELFASALSGTPGYDLPDPVTMAVALDESLITESEDLHLSASTDESTRGQTFADHRLPRPVPNTRVVVAVDSGRFKEMLFALLKDDDDAEA